MNTPNFTLIQLNAQERRQAILRQAQQDQLLAALHHDAEQQSPLRSLSRWIGRVHSALTGAMPKSLEKHTVVRSSVS